MATWVNEQTTSSGGNISLVVSGGYGNVSRNGSSITFNWGVRFRQSSSTYTYNSICARPGGTNYYAQKSSGGIHTITLLQHLIQLLNIQVKQFLFGDLELQEE